MSSCYAVATVSWALAAALGLQDEELTFEHNIEAIRRIAPFAYKAGSPAQRRSGYLQDGYGSRIEEVVTEVVKAGVSGPNIEDSIPSTGLGKGIPGSLYGLEEQVQRLRAAIRVADAAGCPDFAPECPM
ncbi:hypothetical protein EsDP_00004041 [Epichloe bromicola]|uniref:Uncharacterized protein n=1 Tax=Epichloe bromicola TaxID=79588 RepID=A0ABQ0CQJ6_9HYPO